MLADRALSAASDAELAGGLRGHEIAALEEVFRRHASQVALTVRRIAGGCYVDDVVQDVFLSLWRAPERFRPERAGLATYLGLLTRGKALDVIRANDAWHRRHRKLAPRSSSGDDVEGLVMARVGAAALRTALRALPMTERVAIELAFFGGYSYREVAAQLGEPEGTTKSRIRSGLRRLEASLRRTAAAES